MSTGVDDRAPSDGCVIPVEKLREIAAPATRHEYACEVDRYPDMTCVQADDRRMPCRHVLARQVLTERSKTELRIAIADAAREERDALEREVRELLGPLVRQVVSNPDEMSARGVVDAAAQAIKTQSRQYAELRASRNVDIQKLAQVAEILSPVPQPHEGVIAAARRRMNELADAVASARMNRELAATHRCTKCGAQWISFEPGVNLPENEPGSWSLASETCGPCCDNVEMGDQLEAIGWFARMQAAESERSVSRGELTLSSGSPEGCEACGDAIERRTPDGMLLCADCAEEFETIDTCEGCHDLAVDHDVEGVPLCRACFDELAEEVLSQDAAAVREDLEAERTALVSALELQRDGMTSVATDDTHTAALERLLQDVETKIAGGVS